MLNVTFGFFSLLNVSASILKSDKKYNPDENFDQFLEALKKNKPKEWNWLIGTFRQKLIPFLHKRLQAYPSNALLNRNQFVEEVVEETLIQFFKIFQTGSFEKYGDLAALCNPCHIMLGRC